MCIWRNNTRDAPIYADIVVRILHIYPITLYFSCLCFTKFMWNITRPASSLKVIDKRKRYNYFDAFLCIGVSILWSPLLIITSRGRYMIVEDFGPTPVDRPTLGSFLTHMTPMAVATVASVRFSVLTCINIWRARQSAPLGISGQPLYRPLSTIQALRYVALAIGNIIGMILGFLWSILPIIMYGSQLVDDRGLLWYTSFDIKDNLKQLLFTYKTYRKDVNDGLHLMGFLVSIPINGILFFLLFGLGSDTIGIYRVWLDPLRLKASSMIQKFTPKILWRPRGPSSTDAENIAPFQLDDIALAPLPSPVQATRKVYPVARDEAGPVPPATNHLFSPTSPLHTCTTANRESPVLPLERSRTFHKEPIPLALVPIDRLNSRDSPRNASSSVNTQNDAVLGPHILRDAPPRRSNLRDKNDCPPPYDPNREGPGPSESSRNNRNL
ncbi:hypothetical protein FRC18_009332 [Serendipita sp. 400]|nr:hypothetical protein FRC18_009332 [Serendipita sp. 400]